MNWTDRRKQKARRRRVRLTMATLAGAMTALFIAGMLLPAERTSRRRAVLGRPPEQVWRVLTDLDGLPLWRSDITSVERLPDLGGKPAWREVGRNGELVVELSLAEPPRRLVMQASLNGAPGLPVRTFELLAIPGGTEITVTERAHSRNPFRRVLVRLHLPRPAIERLLRELTQRLSVNPRQIAGD